MIYNFHGPLDSFTPRDKSRAGVLGEGKKSSPPSDGRCAQLRGYFMAHQLAPTVWYFFPNCNLLHLKIKKMSNQLEFNENISAMKRTGRCALQLQNSANRKVEECDRRGKAAWVRLSSCSIPESSALILARCRRKL